MNRRAEICRNVKPAELVTEVLEEIARREVILELVSDPRDQERWNQLIRQHHYLKEHCMVGESLRYVAKRDGKWIALLGWSSAAFHLRARDAWIGWTDALRHSRRSLVACHARFVLLGNKATSRELASRILKLNLDCLSEDWQQRYGHPIVLAESFVDPERFEGTCYRAAHWIEIGVTKGFGRSHLDFYQLHDQPKAIFLQPLTPKARQILSAPLMPPAWAAFERLAEPTEYPLTGQQTKSLLAALGVLQDPRRHRGRLHRRVASIVAIATAAMIAGNNSLIDIGAFSQALNQNQLRSLRAARCRNTGKLLAPSESTIRRVLQSLNPDELDRLVSTWLRSHLKDLGIAALAVDGKCVRTASKIKGESIQLFGALDTQTKIVCRQIKIPSKTNEIPTLKDLLAELDLRGALVSADAINTQKSTAVHIVQEKQADYLLVVKANQPKLFDKLLELSKPDSGVFLPPDIALDQAHGRHETREVYPFEITPESSGFPYAVQAALIQRTTHHLKSKRITQEIEMVITSRSSARMTAAQLQAFRRGHWTIEGPLHYVRDVTFGEDRSTARTQHIVRNLACLRNLVIGLCGLDAARQHKKTSCLPRFRCDAKNDDQIAVDLVARPLLKGS
jgi:predicted transposase YbfD/YdcC